MTTPSGSHQEPGGGSLAPDHVMKAGVTHYSVQMPDGTLVLLTWVVGLGGGVAVYEDPNSNPVVTYLGRRK